MSATITDIFKRELLVSVFNKTQNIGVSIGDSDRHYVAIGRSEEWDDEASPPIPYSGVDEEMNFRSSVQAMKLVPDVSYVVPRESWTLGGFYSAWDSIYGSNTQVVSGVTPSAASTPYPYYVLTDENNVFICVAQGKTGSGNPRGAISRPSNVTGNVFSTGDGYYWQFLYNIGTEEARKFLTSTYMPVERIVDEAEGGPADEQLSVSRQQHRTIQDAAVPGQIIGIAIDDPGEYTTAPTITITGRPIGEDSLVSAVASAKIDNGVITDVIMKADSTDPDFEFGENYRDASVEVSGNAKLRAILAGDSGVAGNAVLTLNSSAIMFNVLLDGTENDDFQVTNDFRQIGIIRNPYKDSASLPSFSGDPHATAQTLSALKKLHVTTGNLNPANITGDQIVEQANGSAKAVIDYYDDNGILYVHQTRETGFGTFGTNDLVEVSDGGGTASIVAPSGAIPSLRPAEVNPYTGDVIYIDNRIAVSRDDDQTEDIKIVIDL